MRAGCGLASSTTRIGDWTTAVVGTGAGAHLDIGPDTDNLVTVAATIVPKRHLCAELACQNGTCAVVSMLYAKF